METNTVILDISEYNKLRDHYEKTMKGLICTRRSDLGYYNSSVINYYTKDAIIKELTESIKEEQKSAQRLQNKIGKLEAQLKTTPQVIEHKPLPKRSWWKINPFW